MFIACSAFDIGAIVHILKSALQDLALFGSSFHFDRNFHRLVAKTSVSLNIEPN